jgi:membrane protease subunit HflK
MYLETLQKVFSEADKVILDDNTGGVVPYLPLNELRRGSGSSSQQGESQQ